MKQIYSKKIIDNFLISSSLTKKNKKSIFLYKKQKSYNSLIINNKKYLKLNRTLEFDFLSLKSSLFLRHIKRNVHRTGFKKLINSFLIHSGKSKKLENKIYKSYIYFSKKYPEYWLDKHIELFFSKYAFPLVYSEKYRIFRKRRSKKPHYSRQSLNTISEQKYIFNFFKEFLSKKLTRSFETTFQYNFLILTSSKLGLSSVQKSRTKDNILKWNRFSKSARLFRKEKRKKLAIRNQKYLLTKNTNFTKKWNVSHKFLKDSLSDSIKTNELLHKKKRLYKSYKHYSELTQPRRLLWNLTKSLKNLEKPLFWRVLKSGLTYNFLLSNNFFDSYKDYLFNFSSKLDKKLLKDNIKMTSKGFLYDNILGNVKDSLWSSLRIGKKGFFSLKFSPSYTFFLKNGKEWILNKNEQKFISKHERKKKKYIYNTLQKMFTNFNKSYLTLKYINFYSKLNISSNLGSLKFLDLMITNQTLNKKKIKSVKNFRFIKDLEDKYSLTRINDKKFLNYKTFYITQKILNSFKSNRYNNFLGQLNNDLFLNLNINQKFRLSIFLKKSKDNLYFNVKKITKKTTVYPFFKEEKKINMGLQREKVFLSKGRKRYVLFQNILKTRLFSKGKLKKYEKSFKCLVQPKKYLFKPNYSLILDNLNNNFFYQVDLKKKKFPLMFKLKHFSTLMIYIESSSKETLLKILNSFDNLIQRHFDSKYFKVSYNIKKETVKRLSLLTSPHVNKVAQQHFEKTSNTCVVTIQFLDRKYLNLDSLTKWIKVLNKSSFMCKITLKVKHF